MTTKVLIADDSQFARNVLKDILLKCQNRFQIIEANSAAKTIEMFKKEKPDFVLLDIVMPESEEEGVTVLEKIMQSRPETSVIMVTAVGNDAMIKKCMDLGAKDYITKPFEEKRVISAIDKYLDERATNAE